VRRSFQVLQVAGPVWLRDVPAGGRCGKIGAGPSALARNVAHVFGHNVLRAVSGYSGVDIAIEAMGAF
jgi:hypothetical protein